MRRLLDAHTLIWAVDDPSKLSATAATELRSLGNDLLLGAGTLARSHLRRSERPFPEPNSSASSSGRRCRLVT